MFAVRASHVVDALKELRTAKNSLRNQSRCDRTARDHSDGWGLVSYQGKKIRWDRYPEPAYDDERFDKAIAISHAKTILAHVRRASRGERSMENCHPFVFGRWSFAHNGTLTSVDTLRDSLTYEIAPQLRLNILGQTDSELIFYWIMQRMIDDRAILGDGCVRLTRMRNCMSASISELDKRNQAAEAAQGTQRIARLNVLLTNGSVLVGTRLRNTLYRLATEHPGTSAHPRRSIAIASEPTDSRRWKEIPDASVFSISRRVQWNCESLAVTQIV